MNQKGFTPILLIVIIVVVGAIFVVAKNSLLPKSLDSLPPMKSFPGQEELYATSTPFPSPVSEIKLDATGKYTIYTNYEKGYSFKFPVDWVYKEGKEIGDIYIYPPGQDIDHPYSTVIYTVRSLPNPRKELKDSEEADREFNEVYNAPVDTNFNQRRYKLPNTVVSGKKAVKVVNQSVPDFPTEIFYSLSTYFRYGIAEYSIAFTGDEEVVNKHSSEYNQVLSSFKLLGPAPTPRPITIKTFTNDNLGFSFEFPSNWLVNTFQNNGDYNKGFTLVNEDDGEVITMYFEPGDRAGCDKDYSKNKTYFNEDKKFEFGDTGKTYDCHFFVVKTSRGFEFFMELKFFGTEGEDKGLEIVKSFKGLEIVR